MPKDTHEIHGVTIMTIRKLTPIRPAPSCSSLGDIRQVPSKGDEDSGAWSRGFVARRPQCGAFGEHRVLCHVGAYVGVVLGCAGAGVPQISDVNCETCLLSAVSRGTVKRPPSHHEIHVSAKETTVSVGVHA